MGHARRHKLQMSGPTIASTSNLHSAALIGGGIRQKRETMNL